MKNLILTTEKSTNYELIDSGNREKLERFGEFTFRRPDPQALWRTDTSQWDADLEFKKGLGKTGSWKSKGNIPDKWIIELEEVKMWVKPTQFKHTGVFPEQAPHWRWIKETITASKQTNVNVLNLFGYTGGATIAAAQAGATVTHVDVSKGVVTWAHENAEANNLSETSVRWIIDDAIKFVEKELRRGKKYDGIIMDPPTFGGLGKDMWKIEEDLVQFIEQAKKLLTDSPLFFVVNGYAAGYSSIAYANNLLSLKESKGGEISCGELTIASSKGLLLPAGIYARWSK